MQPRVLRLFGRLILPTVQVKEAAPGALLVVAAAGDPRPRQIRLVDDRQLAVQPLERERDPVEGVQGGQQQPALGEFLGGSRGDTRVVRQREPGGGRKRQRGPGFIGLRLTLGGVDQAHEQTGRGRQSGDPHDAPARGERTASRLRRFARFDVGIHPRQVRHVAHQHRGDVQEPRVHLFGQLRPANRDEAGGGKTPQHGAGQPLGDEPQRSHVILRRDAGHEATGAGAQHMLRRGLVDSVLTFDQEQVDGARFDEPGDVGIAEIDGQIARAGHRRARLGRDPRERSVLRPGHPASSVRTRRRYTPSVSAISSS